MLGRLPLAPLQRSQGKQGDQCWNPACCPYPVLVGGVACADVPQPKVPLPGQARPPGAGGRLLHGQFSWLLPKCRCGVLLHPFSVARRKQGLQRQDAACCVDSVLVGRVACPEVSRCRCGVLLHPCSVARRKQGHQHWEAACCVDSVLFGWVACVEVPS